MRIKFRRAVKSDWAATNPILSDGEPGFELDTGSLKIGDGIKTWAELDYYGDFTDPAVAGLLENPTSQTYEKLNLAVADLVGSHVPGAELAYSEANYSFTSAVAAPNVTSLSQLALTDVIGKGRAVDIEAFFPQTVSTVANGGVGLAVSMMKDGVNQGYIQYVKVYGQSSTAGPPLVARVRKVLVNGSSYNFGFGIQTMTAGATIAAGAGGGISMAYTSVVQR